MTTDRTRLLRLLTYVGAALLALLIAVVAVTAGGPLRGAAATNGTPERVLTAAQPTTPPDRQSRCDAFAAKVAANLGVSQARLQEATKQAALQQVDEALAAGQLTPEQAQRLRERINAGDGSLCGLAGRHNGGPRGGPGGANGIFSGEILNTTADFFGVSREQLGRDLREQRSLQGVAAKYGKDNADDKAKLEVRMEGALRQELAAKGLSAERIDQVAAQFEANFERLYTHTFGQRGPGRAPTGQ